MRNGVKKKIEHPFLSDYEQSLFNIWEMNNNDLNRCFSFLMGVVMKIKSYHGYNEYSAPL